MRESALTVSLEHFEGPLALLLYLIRKEEMDIHNIQIHQITKQYLEHMKLMKSLNLEVASDFITMAATLIYIKSKVLLPNYEENLDEPAEDPRKELVQKLLEYQKYQGAMKKLLDRPILGRDIWRRGFREDLSIGGEQEVLVEENGLFELIASWRNVFKAAQRRIHRVMKKGQSIASRILEIKDRLIPGKRIVMVDILNEDSEVSKNKLLVTFLSMLELAKIGFIRIFQAEPYSDIHVEPLRAIDGDVITRVESYDGGNAEAIAAQLFETVGVESPTSMESQEVSPQEEFHFGSDAESSQENLDMASDEEISDAEKEMGLDAEGMETMSQEEGGAPVEESIESLQQAISQNPDLNELTELEKMDEEKPFEPEPTL